MREYPRIGNTRRKPVNDLDGSKNYGKPCVVCGTGTVGEKFVQVNWMRGEDETVRICADHWKAPDETIIQYWSHGVIKRFLEG